MLGKRQFSLGFLLIELTGIGIALSLFRAVMLFEMEPIGALVLIAAFAVIGATIGALFGRPVVGMALAVLVLVIADLFLPRVH